jgi:hypothetical protein
MTLPLSPLRRLPAALALIALAGLAPAASAQAPLAPPGPPPGNGDLPAPPGTAPTFVPPGTPGAVPGGVPGPGLLGGTPVRLNRTQRSFSVPFACQQSGSARVSVRAVSKVPLARAGYRCAANRAKVKLRVTSKVAKRLARRRSVAATLAVVQGGRTSRLDFQLHAGASGSAPRGYWTDGHLQCTDASGGPQAYLVEPDFTTASPTPISTRGWVAWYTPAGGWHWLGSTGVGSGRWDTWTASVTGIQQFHPDGATTPVPWTMGPIAVPTGQGIVAVGVYEIVYWVGGKPEYQWQYVNAGTTGAAAAGGGNLSCAY